MTGTWPSGWQVGDLEVAAQYGNGIGCISDTTLVGTAASVDITSISSSYAHLWVVVYGRSNTAATSTLTMLRLNNDSGSNYDYQFLQGSGSSVTATEAFAQAQLQLGLMPANTAGANLFAVQAAFIPHYAGSSNNKSVVSLSSAKIGTSTGNMSNHLFGGGWRSSAAITRVTVFPFSGSFVAGTRVSLYGVGG